MDLCKCGNGARYTTVSGRRSCALCCIGEIAVRDGDIPQLLQLNVLMLAELRKQFVSTSIDYRKTIGLIIGQWQPVIEIKVEVKRAESDDSYQGQSSSR